MMATLRATVALDPVIMRLSRQAAAAFESGGIEDELGPMFARIMARRWLVFDGTGRDATVRLAPFAELALLDAVDTARRHGLDSATKARLIGEALALAGY